MLRKAAMRGLVMAAALLAAVPARALVDCGPNTVTVPVGFPTITAAVAAIPPLLPGPWCVNILDSATYNEQVTVQNFINNGSSITIQALSGQFPNVRPPLFSTAAFVIANASVNIHGIGVTIDQNVPFGVLASSPNVSISTVYVNAPGAYAAGIALSSWTTVSNSSVAAGIAHGIRVSGAGNSIAYSTVIVSGPSAYALYLLGADSNTVTQSYVRGLTFGAYLDAGSDFNAISFSTMWATNNAGLYVGASASNTVTQSFLRGGNYGAWMGAGSSHTFISLSTMIASSGYGVLFADASSNTVTQSYIWGGNTGVQLNVGADYNTVSFSTVIGAAMPGYHAVNADWNRLTNSIVRGAPYGASLETNAHYNAVSFTTMTGTNNGLYIALSDSNTVTQSYMYGGFHGATLEPGADYNDISLSTMIGGAQNGLYVFGTSNTVTQSWMSGATLGVRLDSNANHTSISLSTMIGGSLYGLYVFQSDSMTVTQSYMWGGARGATFESGSDYAVISLSTMIGNSSAGLKVIGTDRMIVTRSFMQAQNYGAYFELGSEYNAVSLSTMIGASDVGFYVSGASSNTATGSYLQGGNNGASFNGADYNVISFSTMSATLYAGVLGLNADWNRVESSFILGPSTGVWLNNGSDHNTISLSTVSVTGASSPALYMLGADSNTVTSSYLHSLSGPGVFLSTGADFNEIRGSTITSEGAFFSDYALHLFGASSNTITASRISRTGPGGPDGVYIQAEANGNSIVSSSITAPGVAVTFARTSSNTVAGSHLSGGSGLWVRGSTGTQVSSSRLASTNGYSLRLFQGSVGLSVTGSTATTGPGAVGIYSDSFNGGALEVLDSFISGGSCSVCIETTTVGSTLWVASNTFHPGPSASGFQSLALDGLLYGATIQNNNIYLRTSATGGSGHRGMVLSNSRGLLIERNRINQPGVLGSGGFTGALFNNVADSSFRFNDVHSSGTLSLDSYMLDFTASTVSVRNNVFMSSTTGGGMVAVRADAASGLPHDYNAYHSANGALFLNWGFFTQAFPWGASSGADRHSVSGNPRWADTAAGAEDFHVKSTLGRFDPATQGFVTDIVDSPLLDYADPAEPFALEPAPNGGRANPGSYGNTPEASKSAPPPCPVTLKICKSGLCPFQTIQSAVDYLPNPLTGHSCLHIQDSAVYNERVTVEGFVNNDSSITIRLDPALTIRPTVSPNGGTAAFIIRNSSVNIINVKVSPQAAVDYGILVSSANVSISSVIVADPMNMIGTAGVALSSYSTLSYSSVTVSQIQANGVRLDGAFALVSYSSMAANSNNGTALLIIGAGSNTVTNSFIANGMGNGAVLRDGAEGNFILQSTMTSGSAAGLLLSSADSNTVTGSYMGGGTGFGTAYGAAILAGSNYNTISQSTMASNASSGRALSIDGSSWNLVTQSFVSSPLGYGAYLNDAHRNAVSLSTVAGVLTSGFVDGAAMRLIASSHNAISAVYIQGVLGHGLFPDNGSNANVISGSTITSANTNTALYVRNSSSNAFSASNIFAPTGTGARFDNSHYNTVSLSTLTSNAAAGYAFYLNGADSNTVTGSYLANPAGYSATLENGSDYNTISLSTMASNASNDALSVSDSDGNTLARSRVSNPAGRGVFFTGSDYNTISQSTITSGAAASWALKISGSSTNTIQFSYIQGSTAVIVGGSTGTVINSSVLVAINTTGTALALQLGYGMTLASSTLRGGPSGRGLLLDVGFSSTVSIGSVTVTGAARGIEISTQAAGFVLDIDSITFRGLSAGATAIHFLGGTFTSSITLANFEDASIGANVSAAALDSFPASRISMFAHYGVRTSTAYENDPAGSVFWEAGPQPGCVVTRNVGAGQPYSTIQAGVDALPGTLTGHSCVVIRDGAAYNEQVVIEGFVNNGSSITIMGDPESSTTAPRVSPMFGGFAAFVIRNSSVNLTGIDVRPGGGGGLDYGIFVSSTYAMISSVTVSDAMSPSPFNTAGVALSSWTTVSYASVTVGNAYGFLLPGSTMSSVSFSSATNGGFGRAAVYLSGASSNTFTRVLAYNSAGGGGIQIDGGGYNSVSLSSASTTASSGLFINSSSFNAVSATYMGSAGTALTLASAHGNTISQSTAVSNGVAAITLNSSSSNTLTGVFAFNPLGHGAQFGASSGNTVTLSTFTGGSSSTYGLYLANSSSNSVVGSYLSNSAGPAVMLVNASSNTFSQATVAGNFSNYGLDLNNASYNRFTDVDVLTGARLLGASDENSFTRSTFTRSHALEYALLLNSASSNTVTQSRVTNLIGYPMVFAAGGFANYNTVSESTLTTNSGFAALYLAGTGNRFISDYISGAGDYGVEALSANHTSILLSTITNNSATKSALSLVSSSSNTVSRSVVVNGAGLGVDLSQSANRNSVQQSVIRGAGTGMMLRNVDGATIILSTVTGSGAEGAGLWAGMLTNDILVSHSYVQGSTAVYMSGSTRTIVNASVLAGMGGGSGFWMTGGSEHLSMSSNTVLGGGLAGIGIGESGGMIVLSTNTVIARGSQFTLGVGAMDPAATVWITSNTILPSLSASATTYGIYLEYLAGGATVQNNGIFYRSAGAAFGGLGSGAYGIYANGSAGIKIDHNRISNPSMVTAGNYIGAALIGSPGSIFKFNDLYSTGGTLTTFNLLRVDSSPNTIIRNNMLSSSMTATTNRLIVVDGASQTGFSSDYNIFFSSNAAYSGTWGAGTVSLLLNWRTTTGQDANTLSDNPLWLDPAGEDFHPLSRGGRWNGSGFVADAVSGPGLDRADPADSILLEVAPNGARANQGSYGQTAEASRSVLPCPTTRFVRQFGGGDDTTIQDAVNALDNPLPNHSCIVIGDTNLYGEQVTVQGFINNGSSITIMGDPALGGRPTVTAGFVVRNASVNITGIRVAPTAPINYGIEASSANIKLTSVTVTGEDIGSFSLAAVSLSSFSSLSYSVITADDADGVRLEGASSSVSYSTITSSLAAKYALFINGVDSNTVTDSYISNLGGGAARFAAGSAYNSVSRSTITSVAMTDNALTLVGSSFNTLADSYVSNASGWGTVLEGGSDRNAISLSTLTAGGAGASALYVVGSDSNTVTGSYMANPLGAGLRFNAGADYNTISQSTMASAAAGLAALEFSGGTFNAVAGCFVTNDDGYGIRLSGGSKNNTISACEVSINGAGYMALYVTASSSNSFVGSGFSNPSGVSAAFESGAGYNLVSQSTITASASGYRALTIFASDFNRIDGSFISSLDGGGARLWGGADFNTISRSTVTGDSSSSPALLIADSSSNTVVGSYIQGSTAAIVSGSTGTVINASVLVATNTTGVALTLQSGSMHLALSSNTFVAGPRGDGVFLDAGNAGTITLSTNTILGGRASIAAYGQQPGTALWITSNTVVPSIGSGYKTYGVYFDGLTSGATVQNNGIFYRARGATAGGDHTSVMVATASAGLVVSRNRMSNPGMVDGLALGVGLTNTPNTVFEFNDVHSTGSAITSAFHMRLDNSPGAQLHGNVFSSSWSAIGASTAALYVDVNSQAGFVSNYNAFFSSNSYNSIEWGAAGLAFPWSGTTGRDANSLARHPRWKDVSPGVEDFHHLSHAGRWNGTAFVNDGFTSGLLDAADPALSAADETAPNGTRVNLGSYGGTAEASRSPERPVSPAVAEVLTSSIVLSYGLTSSPSDGYLTIASTDANFTGAILVSSTADNGQTTLAASGLAANTTYFTAVAAVWGEFYSFNPTVLATATLAYAPGTVSPAFTGVSTSALTARWSENGNFIGLTTYTVVFTTGGVYPNAFSGNQAVSTAPAGASLNAARTGLAPNTTYFAFAAARNWNGTPSAYTLLGSTATLAAEPLSAASTFSAVGFSSFSVSWDAAGNPLSVTTYTVTVSIASDFNETASSVAFSTVPAFGPAAEFTGLDAYTTYYFRVRAVNPNGIPTAYALLGSTQTRPVSLAAPAIAGVTAVSSASITAAWGLSPLATGYTLVASLTNDPAAVAASSAPLGIAATTATVNSLAANTTYYLFVQATGPGAATGFSAFGATSTLAASPLSAASTFSAVYTTSMTVSWLPGGNPVGVTSYTVVLSTGAAYPNSFADNRTLSTAPAGAVLAARFTGLFDNTAYFVHVSAVNHNGVDGGFVFLGSTVTRISAPTSVIFDEVSSNTIVASAYAASPSFSNLGAGLSGTQISKNAAYQPVHGEQWAPALSMPAALRDAGAAGFNGKVYIAGGFTGAAAQNAAAVYDPATGVWTALPSLTSARGGLAAASVGGRIYAVGGTFNGATSLSANEEYDPVANAWTTKAPLPAAGNHLSAAGAGGALFAFAGLTTGVDNEDTFQYDPAADAWTPRPDFPALRHQPAAGAAAGPTGGLILAAGGSGPADAAYGYDTTANAWSVKASMPAPAEQAAAASLGGKIFVIGGAPASGAVHEYDPAEDAWTTRAAMTTGRAGASVVAAGGRIYVLGGTTDGGAVSLSVNEEYDPGTATRFAGLAANTPVLFKARARGQAGTLSAETIVFSTWTLAALPAADAAPFLVVEADSITFSWALNGNPGATEFRARASTAASFGGGAAVVSSDWGEMTSTAALALAPNTTYFFQSAARNGALGDPGIPTAWVPLGSTATLAAVPAPAPASFAGAETNGLTVSWLPNGNPLSITTYTVVVSTDAVYPNANTGNVTVASTFPAGALPTASLAGLVANTTYFAFVSAVNHNGARTAYEPLGSTATLALPPAAASPAFSAASTSAVTFSWLPNGNPLNVTTYSVVLSTGGAFNAFAGNVAFSTAPSGAAPTATASAGLIANTTYYGYAAAINSAGAVSAYASLGATATLAALPETAIATFTAVHISSLTVSWSAAGNPLAITTYTVQLSTAADFNAFASSVVFATAPAAGPSATFTGLSDYTEYFFRVRAVNHGGSATAFVALGSTLTLVAPLDAPALAGFSSIDVTSITASWGLVSGATGYTLVASLLPANPPTAIEASSVTLSINETTAAAYAPPLSPNTTYFLFVRANGPTRSSEFAAYGSTSTMAAAPATAASTFTGVGITSFTVSWDANGNALAITTYTVQLSTAADFNAFAASVTFSTVPAVGTSAMLTGLSGNTLYYLRMRSINHNGMPSAYVNLGSTLTVESPLFPTVMNSQTGDAAWRRANTTLYSVAFLDTSGAHLDKFQVKASTTEGGLGTDIAPWTDVVVGLSPIDSYSTPWALPSSVFTALLEGVTNYISVRVFNGSPLNNFTVMQDAFYVQKDTTPPVIVNAQAGDSVARSAGGTTYAVGVRDPSSGLAAFQYSASLSPMTPNASLIGWTDIPLPAGATMYDVPWTVDFAALTSGVTNYISVRSWDTAGATTTVADAFFVHKDTTGPSVAIATPQNGSFNSALTTLSGTAASIYGVQGTEVSVLDVLSNLYWNPGSSAFNSAAPVLLAAAGGAAWTLSPGITWVDGASYVAVARSSTTAGLYSTTYATAAFIMDLSKPAVAVLAPAPDSTVSALAQISGTAADPAPNASGLSSVEVRLRRNADGLWWNWFTQAWGPAAVSSVTAGTTAWSLSPTPQLKGNLDDGASYFIAVRASDNALPANQGDFFTSGSTFTWQDTTPPSAVADLAASHGTASGVINLAWTAPGDDAGAGMIVLGEYRVFYSTDIAAVASTSAAQILISTAGINPGDLQSYTITGLSPSVTYYVSLALDDGDGNWSAFSNQASTTASPSPLNAITGHVLDVSTQGITAVQVDCWNSADALVGTTFTLADGSGTFTVEGLPAGNYKLRVTWTVNGFSSSLWQDGIAMGSTGVDFFLEINYALATLTGTLGTLTNASFGSGGLGTASVSESFIELHQQGRQVARTTVQPTGRWAIPGLLPGTYSVRAFTGLGYTAFQEVQLSEGEVKVLGFVFNPLPEASVFAFPNPARTATTIRFETALAPMEAGIYIFDLAGNLVKEFSDSQISRAGAPTYRAAWDLHNASGRPVAPGVYHVMVKVKGGSENQAAKVIKKLAVVR